MFLVGLGKDLINNLDWTNIVGGLSTMSGLTLTTNNMNSKSGFTCDIT
jgi:hypothetical protein